MNLHTNHKIWNLCMNLAVGYKCDINANDPHTSPEMKMINANRVMHARLVM